MEAKIDSTKCIYINRQPQLSIEPLKLVSNRRPTHTFIHAARVMPEYLNSQLVPIVGI